MRTLLVIHLLFFFFSFANGQDCNCENDINKIILSIREDIDEFIDELDHEDYRISTESLNTLKTIDFKFEIICIESIDDNFESVVILGTMEKYPKYLVFYFTYGKCDFLREIVITTEKPEIN